MIGSISRILCFGIDAMIIVFHVYTILCISTLDVTVSSVYLKCREQQAHVILFDRAKRYSNWQVFEHQKRSGSEVPYN